MYLSVMCVGSHLRELAAMDPSRDSAILRARRFYKKYKEKKKGVRNEEIEEEKEKE